MSSRSTCQICFVLGVLIFTLTGVGAADDPLAAKLSQVDALFQDCDRVDRPGAAVGIILNGKPIYAKGFGSANLVYEAPNTPSTVFELASASKGFTSACLALLMDQGKIAPHDDVRKFLPELHPHDPPVRIRDMLRCESGIWAQFHIMPLAGWVNVPLHTAHSKEDLFEVLKGQKRMPFPPGEDFEYSSSDFFLLGLVVERVTGQTLAQFAKTHLFDPLGMKRTYYEEDPALVVKNRAVGHWKRDEGWSGKDALSSTPWSQWQANGYVAGGGGVNSTVEDLILWNQPWRRIPFPRENTWRSFASREWCWAIDFV